MDEDGMEGCQLNNDKKPEIGMEFPSIDDAYAFYNRYAREVGFGVRKEKSAYRKNTGEIMNKYFLCWKAGMSKLKGTQRIHAIDRENCSAKLVLLKKRDCTTWKVSQFIEQHNHALTTPRKTGMLRSHREVSAAKKQLIMELSEINIPIYKQIGLFELQSGGIQNMGCTDVDIYNYRRDLRRQAEGHDVELLEEHFREQTLQNSSFYFKLDLNEENILDKCFWADSFSRRAYGCYGDVIVFDTTYNTNKYDMKFAPFVGVNKHGQTIVFACAFLSNETTTSFVWAFEQFKLAMPGVDPTMIITDQAAAIANAISSVYPNALHRLCIWHIQNKFSAKLNSTSEDYNYKAFHNCIWYSETREEFDTWWQIVLEKTNTVGNVWLESIFALRSRWVPAYCNDVFSAGMASSQRVEGTHAFFKSYISKQNSLMEFIIRFNRALSHQRHKELEKNNVDLTTQPSLKTVMSMERQMSVIYTRTIFLKFQIELTTMLACVLRKAGEDEIEVLYKVDDGSFKERSIYYDKVNDLAMCSCRKFQAEGIPCKHLLAYLRIVSQKEYLPETYILKRWTKLADAEVVMNDSGCIIEDVIDNSLVMHKSKLSRLASQLVDLALESNTTTMFLYQYLEKGLEELKKMPDKQGNPPSRDPLPVRGIGSGKRLKNPKEIAMQSSKRHCTLCGKTGHDKRNCAPRSDATAI